MPRFCSQIPHNHLGKWRRDLATQPSCLRAEQFTSTSRSFIRPLHSSLTHIPKHSLLLQAQVPSISCLGMTEMRNNYIIVLSSWVARAILSRENNLSLEFRQSMNCSVFYTLFLRCCTYMKSILTNHIHQ